MEIRLEFNLDVLLFQRRLNMAEAQRLCGLSYPTIHGITNNATGRIDIATIEKLCNGLNVQPGDLFREKQE